MTKVQFVTKRDPGTVLHEAEIEAVPQRGDYVTVPGYNPRVVGSVHWVFEDGAHAVAVVLE